jgi:hypothetical protein
MKLQLLILSLSVFAIISCTNGQPTASNNNAPADAISKIEMNLSAFGVESDNFPSIEVFVDFAKDSSHCMKTFYNPANQGSTYSLTKNEMKDLLKLLKVADLEKLKKEYRTNNSDQPSSKTVIYTSKTKFIIDDYGLEGEYPLQELYKIVYKY